MNSGEMSGPATAWWLQVHAVYQPVVDLDTRRVVGYEALARGPRGSPLHTPDALFAAARDQGVLVELDWACRLAAVSGALTARLPATLELFINVEPPAVSAPPPADATAILRAATDLSIIMEITERDLTADPAGLLRAAAGVRARGWRVALDDVGADPASLALLPLLHPDVIKLDLRLVQANTSTEVADIITAVNAHAERSGALVLAEGIETEDQAQFAVMMGARLGQGWLFGRPAPLPPFPDTVTPPTPRPARHSPTAAAEAPAASSPAHPSPQFTPPTAATPYGLVQDGGGTRRSTKPLLMAISRQLEHQALGIGASAVVFTTLQHARNFTTDTARRYARLAADTAFVAVFATDLAAEPTTGVRGVALSHADPLTGEWSVIVIGPHFTGALLARDVGDTEAEAARRFDYQVTYNRPTVLAAATLLMHHIPSSPTPGPRPPHTPH